VLVVRVVGDELCEAVRVPARGRDSLKDEADPGFTEVQAALVGVVGVVGHVVLVEIRDVVAPELDEPATLQLVKGTDDSRSAGVQGVVGPRFVLVLGVRRPAVVEGGLSLGDDFPDRVLDRGSVPRLVDQGLVALGIEERQR
jgi:hypothetical protein